jgi:hypothetical protein
MKTTQSMRAVVKKFKLDKLNNGGLVSEGPTGEPEGHAAAVGGLGSFSGAKRRRRSLCLRGK